MQKRHLFAKFGAILARGKTKTRPLTLDEAGTMEQAQDMAKAIWAPRDNFVKAA